MLQKSGILKLVASQQLDPRSKFVLRGSLGPGKSASWAIPMASTAWPPKTLRFPWIRQRAHPGQFRREPFGINPVRARSSELATRYAYRQRVQLNRHLQRQPLAELLRVPVFCQPRVLPLILGSTNGCPVARVDTERWTESSQTGWDVFMDHLMPLLLAERSWLIDQPEFTAG
jgi:hypothetical protein